MRRSLEVGEGREPGLDSWDPHATWHLLPPRPPAPPCWEGSQCCTCAEGTPMIQRGISVLSHPHADPLRRSLFERGGVSTLGGCLRRDGGVEGEWPGSSLEIQTGCSLRQHSSDGILGTEQNAPRRFTESILPPAVGKGTVQDTCYAFREHGQNALLSHSAGVCNPGPTLRWFLFIICTS